MRGDGSDLVSFMGMNQKRELEKLAGKLEDARTSLEEARADESLDKKHKDRRLDDVADTLNDATEALEEIVETKKIRR